MTLNTKYPSQKKKRKKKVSKSEIKPRVFVDLWKIKQYQKPQEEYKKKGRKSTTFFFYEHTSSFAILHHLKVPPLLSQVFSHTCWLELSLSGSKPLSESIKSVCSTCWTLTHHPASENCKNKTIVQIWSNWQQISVTSKRKMGERSDVPWFIPVSKLLYHIPGC